MLDGNYITTLIKIYISDSSKILDMKNHRNLEIFKFGL